MNLHEIESRYEKLCDDRENASDAYKNAERECEDLKRKKDNLLSFMGEEPSQETERSKDHTRT
mgnify:FL=1